MKINIVSKRNALQVGLNTIRLSGDRSSPIGNPFYLSHESLRTRVCELYKLYFHAVVFAGYEPQAAAESIATSTGLKISSSWINPTRASFLNYLDILKDTEPGKTLELLCWCDYPNEECHLKTVVNYLENYD